MALHREIYPTNKVSVHSDCDDEPIESSSEANYDTSSDVGSLKTNLSNSSDEGDSSGYDDHKRLLESSVTSPTLPEISGNSYSYSKSWISEEESYRKRFQKSIANLHHMGCDDSFVLPVNFEEWLNLKFEYTSFRISLVQRQMHCLLMDLSIKRHHIACGSDIFQEAVSLSTKLTSTAHIDARSVVLGRQTIWSTAYTDRSLAYWPSYKDFKAEGDDRVKGHRTYGRQLPLPKPRETNQVHCELLEKDMMEIFTQDWAMPHGFCQPHLNLVHTWADMMPQTEATERPLALASYCEQLRQTEEISLVQVDEYTRKLIEEIKESE